MSAKTDAVMIRPKEGHSIHTQLKHYIDSDILLREFTMAADILSAAWICKTPRHLYSGLEVIEVCCFS